MAAKKLTRTLLEPNAEYWDSNVFFDVLDSRDDDRRRAAKALFTDFLADKRVVYTSTLTAAEVAFLAEENQGTLKLTDEHRALIEKLWRQGSRLKPIEVSLAIAEEARNIKRLCMGFKNEKGEPYAIPMDTNDAVHLATARVRGIKTFYTFDEYKYEPEPVDAPKQPPRKKMEKRKNAAKGTPTKPPMPDRRPDLSKLLDMAVSAPPKKGLLQFSDPKLAAATPTAQVEAPPELPSPPPA